MDNLVISPEPFIQKCRSLAKAKNLYLDVMDGLVRLAWTSYSDDSAICLTESIDRIEGIRLGISYEMIRNALEEAGGTIGIKWPLSNKRCNQAKAKEGLECQRKSIAIASTVAIYTRRLEPLGISRFMATWREGGKTRNVHLGSCGKIGADEARQKALKMKAEAFGVKS